MKKGHMAALAALALSAGLLAAPVTAAAAEIKLGVVDLQKALNETQEGKAVKETLQSRYQPKIDLLASKEKDLKDIQEKLKSSVLAKEAKATLQKDFERKLGEYQELAGKTKVEMDRDNKAATAKIIDGLVEIVLKIGKDEGFTLILEKSNSGILFGQDSLDLTDRALKLYNEKNPAGGEKKQ